MKLLKDIIIAIDGHSSCGKSTLAKSIAKLLGYAYIDTGAMYRATTLNALNKGLLSKTTINEEEITKASHSISIEFKYSPDIQASETYLNGNNVEQQIRGLEISNRVSEISKIKEVRKMLVAKQQEMGKNKRIVMDGRDIGTVVFPRAEIKIFLTASEEVRAQRRYNELKAKNETVSFEEVLENIQKRDLIDSTRKESPLTKAEDAIVLDNSTMNLQNEIDWFKNKLIELGYAS